MTANEPTSPPTSSPDVVTPTGVAATPAPVQEIKAVKPTRTIKRYSNRKLYDTESSKYVTLEEIAQMVKAGEEIVIIDNKTKDDLTAVTLTQIIYEEEKRKSRMPLGMLRQLITSSGDAVQEFFEKQVKAPVVETIDQANKSVVDLRQKAEKIGETATQRVTELTEKARTIFQRGENDLEKKAEEALKEYEGSFDALKKRIEAQTSKAEADGARVVGQVVERLEEQVAELGTLLTALRAKAETMVVEKRPSQDPGAPKT